ncbi:MAG: TIGR03792 family protein [Synechococcus sp.]
MLFAARPQASLAAFPDPEGGYDVAIVEQLRVKVPAAARQAWLEAERQSWDPWLRRQDGFLGRDLFWDEEREEGLLLIRWASREQWKAIPEPEVEAVQERFEQLARQATGQEEGNPFPLVLEGELQLQRLRP